MVSKAAFGLFQVNGLGLDWDLDLGFGLPGQDLISLLDIFLPFTVTFLYV